MTSARVLIIAGPTSSGKTDIALRLALEYEAPIVSADAMQVYRGMDIGTGKATLEERARVPHHAIDIRDPDEGFDASDFVALCDEVIATHPRVIIAGGTCLYLRALLRGLVETPPVDPEVRKELEDHEDLHGLLAEVDPELAAGLHPNDRVRLIRGVEVFRATGTRLSELHRAHAAQPDRIEATGMWLDRPDLTLRIDQRVLTMIGAGYVDEVRDLLDAGYARDLKPMTSLGYRHMAAHLLDGLALEEAVRLTQRDTRRYARKQRNWRKIMNFPTVAPDDEAGWASLATAALGV